MLKPLLTLSNQSGAPVRLIILVPFFFLKYSLTLILSLGFEPMLSDFSSC